MTATVQIRPFQDADFPELDAIRARAFAPVFRSLRHILGPELGAVVLADAEEEQARLLRQLCAPGSADRIYVATLGGQRVGFVSISFDQARKIGEIGLNAVDPVHAGQGIGTQLYAFALEEMRRAGMKVAAVSTGADASHAPARRAYEKAGFCRTLPNQWMYKAL